MDRQLLDRYNSELQHLHEMGAEFASQFPKIAGRLGMSGLEVADAANGAAWVLGALCWQDRAVRIRHERKKKLMDFITTSLNLF